MNIEPNKYTIKHNNRLLVKLALFTPMIRLLHRFKIGWKYQYIICKLNLYPRHSSGSCYYCGGYH